MPKNKLKPVWLKKIVTNWLSLALVGSVGFVTLMVGYRLFISPDQFYYARVKVSQGLWWANTNRAPAWFLKALKPGLVEKDLSGEEMVKIKKVNYYPYYGTSQYDVYLTLKLKVSGNPKNGSVSFNRANLAVGSPIELSFNGVEFAGTVFDLSATPFKERLVAKSITLSKSNAYQWEYDAIRIGDSYFDGEEHVFKIMDKSIQDNPLFPVDSYGTAGDRSVIGLYPETRKIITVKAQIKLSSEKDGYYYGVEQEIKMGKSISIATKDFYFEDFRITSID